MSIIKWEPFGEIEKVFNNGLTQLSEVDLATDIYVEDTNLIVKMSLPGVSAEHVDVTLEDGILTVDGRREEERESKGKDYFTKEILRGSFLRRISLPKLVEPDKATSHFTDGLLTITLPIVEGDKDRRVKIPITNSQKKLS